MRFAITHQGTLHAHGINRVRRIMLIDVSNNGPFLAVGKHEIVKGKIDKTSCSKPEKEKINKRDRCFSFSSARRNAGKKKTASKGKMNALSRTFWCSKPARKKRYRMIGSSRKKNRFPPRSSLR